MFSDNKQAVVRELFNSSNKPDELSALHSTSEKGKTYDVEHPGASCSAVADTPQQYSNSMINYNIIIKNFKTPQ